MAGDWIKMRSDLFTHPKVVRISSALKADRLRTVGGLMAVWCLFDAHSVDGKLDGYTLDALDDLIGWPGFSASMASIGWLEDHGDSLSTPRFDEHNGQSAKRRATETERKRVARAVGDSSADDADKKRSREEKRREEEKPSSRVRASRRCPREFLVEAELQQWAREKAPLVDIRAETEAFRDCEFPKAHADWPATWRGWMRREQKRLALIQRPADVARLTVPSKPPSPDSALEQMKRDVMTPEERERSKSAKAAALAGLPTYGRKAA